MSKSKNLLTKLRTSSMEEEAGIAVDHSPSRTITKTVSFGSINLRVYSIGYLANALDRSSATIRRWQRKGVIQPPIIDTKDGARWYLKEEIQLYVRLAKEHDVQIGVSIDDSGFPEAVVSAIKVLRKRIENTVKGAREDAKG